MTRTRVGRLFVLLLLLSRLVTDLFLLLLPEKILDPDMVRFYFWQHPYVTKAA